MVDTAVLSFVTLFITVGPIELAAVFTALTPHTSQAARRRIATKATIVAGCVLVLFAYFGNDVMRAFGIGFPAFRIAGGILLMLLSIDMVLVRHSGLSSITQSEEREAEHENDISVFPLAIPLIAGPGAMTAIVLLMGSQSGRPLGQVTIIATLVAVLAIAFVALLLAARLTRHLGITGVNVVQRIFGILLASLAVQFVLDGLREAHIFG